ncbi:MAG: amylo-alpha-1,6-glucosidase [Nitrososphaerota archaeon]|nr:amylo-alpha-1,6-glucosidase [Candidatus Bathyarchaeota archaeon]MDW8041113.1 amylo-alpha-1,6-glucosidase [Nitrososphaerota archaeon]
MFRLTPQIIISREELSKPEALFEKEWLIANGLGGYASSTVLGVNTRKYHGMLVAAFHPPRKRVVCITKFDEELRLGNLFYPLYANEFQGGVYPRGFQFLEEFSLSPFPRYVYVLQNLKVSKIIFMPHGRNAAIALYTVENGNVSNVEVYVFPILACRHFHAVVNRWQNPPRFAQKTQGRRVKINVEAPTATVMLEAAHGVYQEAERWLEKVYFREEHARGESYLDDWFQSGFFTFKVGGKTREKFAVVAVAGEDERAVEETMDEMPATAYDVEGLYEAEVKRRERLLERFYGEHGRVEASDWLSWLVLAADAFIVEALSRGGKAGRSVVAGYHWFEDWGRDAFVALPGLMLVTGRFEDAKRVFLTFNEVSAEGLIPNFISDLEGQPAYNCVDANLWFVNAVLQYLKYTGDFAFVQTNLWENMKKFVENLVRGVYGDMRLDDDGLVLHGARMTWMDTMVDGKPVTPREGKAVEVQALWYNALKTLELLAKKFGEKSEAEKFAVLAEKAKGSLNEKFWNPAKNCLFDVVDKQGVGDPSVRPNQILAVSLDFTALDKVKAKKVVDTVRRELLTTYGLRTLTRGDQRYRGVYCGDRRSRDLAYHNGAVWPWLLGPFTKAYLKTEGYGDYAREYAFKNFLAPLLTEQVFKAGLGNVSEIFDGDLPHTPRGCVAQAWSVAEPLRAYVEDVMFVRPKHERDVLSVLG